MKKHYLKKGLHLLASLALLLTTFNLSKADAKTSPNGSINFEESLHITESDYIIIDNNTYSLYKVFANQENALEVIKLKIPEALSSLAEIYKLEELNNENWREYEGFAYEFVGQLNIENEYYMDINELLNFFDIYENAEKNTKIQEYVHLKRSTLNIEDPLLGMVMPTYSDIAINYNNKVLNKNAKAASINVTAAINYASKYATSYNPMYDNFSSDCTNFVSQILEACGVSQVVTNSSSTGWWSKIVDTWNGMPIWNTSVSWINADIFCRYMGVGYTTTINSNFAYNIQKGDFVAFDKFNDGDFNHCGFVTDVATSSMNHGGKTYKDYKIAQHTNNYHAWASSSTNGWETLEDLGYKYARIRR